MSEFEKDLKYLPVHIRTVDGGDCYDKEQLIYSFKDWQPPKELIEVPQRFADWIESQTDREEESYWYIFDKFIKDSREKSTGIDYFGIGDISTYPQGWDRVLLSALVDGYTVKKEQLYHVVLPEVLNRYLNFRINNGDAMFGSSEEIGNYKTKFTEQEIKDIDPRYWAFAVKVEG